MANAKTPASASRSKAPASAFRMRGISAAVFENEFETADGRKFTRFDVSVQRRYRDGDEYKTTTVFRRDDLPTLQLLVQRAWEYIVDVESRRGTDEDEQ